MVPMLMPRTASVPAPRGRIGAGFSPAPHRYHLYLSTGCPRSLRVETALALLGLTGSVGSTLLGPPATHAALRRAYEAAGHHYDGALAVPALCDTWSGRVVSNHAPDILDDLAVRLAGRPDLSPPLPARPAGAVRALLDEAAPQTARAAALDLLEHWLAVRPYALGDRPTLADVDLWVALLDPAVLPGAGPRTRAYVRRLRAHPAFGTAA
ncbi:glutathione S-transferase family protein [Streptomyces sp. NPDC006512]|uniref:glutathione S-transferase family protein n=1 Tax=Streptomyces sp. NPDC006512 TaxID=3154307 RepID=UPI0033B86B84